MAAISPAPGSPPELTGSKSSKSSSFHSSSHLDGANDLNDVANFEDIGLEDDNSFTEELKTFDRYAAPKQLGTRTLWRSGSTASFMHAPPARELTSSRKRAYPGLHAQANKALTKNIANSLGTPARNGMKRGFSSPSAPSLSLSDTRKLRSRTPSPARSILSTSPRSLPATGPVLRTASSSTSVRSANFRHDSWQPGRKSVQELEDEYHDSDEELPEDASLFNVPISPRPPQERGSTSSSHSKTNSPTRVASRGASPLQSPNSPLPSENKRRAGAGGSRSPQKRLSTGSIPALAAARLQSQSARTRSWNAALSELSDEARSLTEALEEYAEETERLEEEKIQKGVRSVRESQERLRKTRSVPIELPPIQKCNVMIDPLPCSKEKEKVLTRTRPSWLPPKDPKEEKRHLKEYGKMMAKAREAEKRRLEREEQEEKERERTRTALHRLWEEQVLPCWDKVIKEPRTRELWWCGVAPHSRATVWKKAIGNELALKEESYRRALRRAKEVEKSSEDQHHMEKEWFKTIRADIVSAFPEMKIFQKGGPLYESLVNILMAYSMYRSDVGYVYGTHFLAALLLLNLSAADTFITLSNVLNRPMPLAFQTRDPGAISRAYSLTSSTLQYKYPHLHHHLFGTLKLTEEQVYMPLFQTVFLQGLDIECGSRLFDVWAFEGDRVLIRCAVAILGHLEPKLYGDRNEILKLIGWKGRVDWQVHGPDAFMKQVREAGKIERSTNRSLTDTDSSSNSNSNSTSDPDRAS